MARKESAGLLMYRLRGGALEVLLAHPGGPFWARRDQGAWSIPKGELEAGEEPLETARREFEEETGVQPEGPYLRLPDIEQKNRKLVHAWAFEGDCDPSKIRSNTFRLEWPPRSGKTAEFPEIDRARRKINPAQAALVDALEERLKSASPERRTAAKNADDRQSTPQRFPEDPGQLPG